MVFEEEEKTCDLASWEEISEDGGVMALSFFSLPGDSSDSDQWDIVSFEDNEVKSLSNQSMTWTYRDALLLSGKIHQEPKSQIDHSGQQSKPLSVLVKKNTKIQVQPTFKTTKTRRFAEEEKEEYNEHLLDLDDKPMSEKHRRKFERAGRRRLLRGHTGRVNIHQHDIKALSRVSLESGDPEDLQPGEEHVTALEAEFRGTHDKRGTTKWNMNKKGSWNRIPEILRAEAVQVEFCSGGADRRGKTKYILPVKEIKRTKLSRETKEALRDEERRARFIWIMPPGRPLVNSPQMEPRQIFAEVFKGPPADIVDESMIWTLRGKVGNCKNRKNVAINGSCALFVEDGLLLPGTQQRFFEIDLGGTRSVTAVSTQGAPPPVRQYPTRTDLAFPGGHVEWHSRFSYKGPTWQVYDPSIPYVADARCGELRWVRSYKLFWRADHGHRWHYLGLFRGNVDTTTEKATVFASIGILEVTCRFLRIVPVDCENGGALRIGVYGKSEGNLTKKTRASTTSMKGDSKVVEYTLYEPSTVHAPGADLRG